MKSELAIFLVVAVLFVGTSLAADDGVAFFEKEIRPILVEHCYECHSAKSEVQGGLRLDSRVGVEAGGDSGKIIVKGKPEASLLVEAIRYQNRDLQMPPKNALPAAAIAKLVKWIRIGAPDPREAAPTEATGPRGMSIEDGRQFWSFRPVEVTRIPEVDTAVEPHPIDAFVLAKLVEHKLTPAQPATRRTLIRRVTQNLIGLPPTPEEVAAFIADESPDAFEKVVNRLLDSPQYGVRWGRHWLDVARYADSNGLDENIGFGNAWRYRDYVVDSFNADKPYDRFLIEQLAGDLLPDPSAETITATCFLQLGPKVLAEPDVEKLHMDVIDEQLDTLGKTFLGMSFGCVRCHDHKFDPLKQSDYYGLAAIFKSTKTIGDKTRGVIKYWYEHSVATQDDKKRIEEVDKELSQLKSAASSYKNQYLSKLRADTKAKAADYLVACTQFQPGAELTTISAVAATKGLHARILHHCRTHLEFYRDDPVFDDWHSFVASDRIDDIHRHYSALFQEAEAAFAEARKNDPKVKVLDDERLQSARAALHDPSGFLAIPSVDSFALDEETLAEYYRLQSIARAFETTAPDEPAIMAVADGEVATTIPMFIRGNHRMPGEEVGRSFPVVMSNPEHTIELATDVSGRLELARWLASPEHPLTARVMVNRIWAWHFSSGLVASTENFGTRGDRPSHPKLLDWLTGEFVKSGWSIKAMHRLILSSTTWQMASRHPSESKYLQIDPENRLLWKQNLRRLEAEQIRDSILAVSGRLDLTLGGKTLPLRNRQFVFNHTSEDHTTYESLRRAIYLPVIRNNLYPLFEQFDFPDPTMPTGSRNETVIASQALVLMNDPLVLDSAEAMARAVTQRHDTTEQRLEDIYLRAFARGPKPGELARGKAFIDKLTRRANEERAWSLFCQGMLAGNEFLHIQ